MNPVFKLLIVTLPLVFATNVSVADLMTLYPAQDAHVASGTPDANYGSSEVLYVSQISWPVNTELMSYLKFNLSPLPTNCYISSASLELKYTDPWGFDYSISVYTAASSWSEGGITYNNQPGAGSYITSTTEYATSATFYISRSVLDGWQEAPETNHGFLLEPDMIQLNEFHSREGLGTRPKLVVNYSLPPAIIDITPTEFTIDWQYGNPNPSGTFIITNNGAQVLVCTLTDDAEWMSVLPHERHIVPGYSCTFTVTVDSSPGAGTHVGTITVSAPDAYPSEDYVTVTLNCYQAHLEVDPDTIDLGWDPLEPEPSTSFEIQNPGNVDLEWSLADDSDLLVCTPVSGTVGPGAIQTVTVDTENWPGAGTYTGIISITDPLAFPPLADVTINLTCYQAELAIAPDAIDLTWNTIDPAPSDSFLVQNPGTSDLIWSLEENADWLLCTPESGTVSPGEVQSVAVDIDVWPGEGTYLEQIIITAPDANPEQDTVDVALTCTDIAMRLTLTPPTDPVVVSPGGSFEYDLLLESGLEGFELIDIWAQAVLPNSNVFNVWQVYNFPIGPNTVLPVQNLYQAIPFMAPIGDYGFRIRAGHYPNQIYAQDSFGFSVQGASIAAGAGEWSAGGFGQDLAGYLAESDDIVTADAEVPSEFVLHPAYPNPFNPSTTLSVSLPEATKLNVAVFNIAGQQVATLANGQYSAGSHTLTFDASHLSGGVYFVQATAGSWNDVQKVVLMK
jgi:Secretion system C-terminal sorting domain/Viral BACON domain